MRSRLKELLIKSILSFPRRRESMRNKVLDPRFRGDDELISASLKPARIESKRINSGFKLLFEAAKTKGWIWNAIRQ